MVGVIEPDGAGKTTLFNIICGFVTPLSGTITYNGHTIDGRQPHHLTRLGIARTLQGVGLWNGLTIIENVMAGGQAKAHAGLTSSLLGLWRSSREETRLRRRAGELLPRARDRPVRRGPSERSALHGAKARSLGPRPDDRPDPATARRTGERPLRGEMDGLKPRLIALRAWASVLLVEHHMDLVMSSCDRLVVLNFGQAIAQGTPSEVKANPEVTTAYLGDDVRSAASGSAPTGSRRARC